MPDDGETLDEYERRRREEESRAEYDSGGGFLDYWGGKVGDVTDAAGLNPGRERAREDQLRAESRAIWDQLYGAIPQQNPLEAELARAYADPGAVRHQEAALAQLAQLSAGGTTGGDLARLRQIQTEQGRQERSQREAVMQSQQARGMGRSGTALAGQLAAQQGAAGRANEFGLGVEALAQQRQMEAVGMRGKLAGDMRGSSFREEATRRAAYDEASRYNRETPWRQYGALERIAQGKTGTVLDSAASAQQREQEARRGLGAIVGGVTSWLTDEDDD